MWRRLALEGRLLAWEPIGIVRLGRDQGKPARAGPYARRRWTSAEKRQILALRAPPQLVSATAWLNGLPASVLLM